MSDDTFFSTPRRPTYLPSDSFTTLASQSKGRENSWCSWELNEAVKMAPSPSSCALAATAASLKTPKSTCWAPAAFSARSR